jgi:hypothetical protein
MKTQLEIYIDSNGRLQLAEDDEWRYLKLNVYHQELLLALLDSSTPKGYNQKAFRDAIRMMFREEAVEVEPA